MFDKKIYINRRQKLKKLLKEGIVLILGNSEIAYNYSANPYGKFRQYSSFLYFFGLDYPDMVGLMDLDNDKEYIFANDLSIEDIVWTGPQKTISEKAEEVGITGNGSLKDLENFLTLALNKKRKIHFLPQYRDKNKIFLSQLLKMNLDELNKKVSLELISAIAYLRSHKEPYEIQELEKAQVITHKIHSFIAKNAKPKMYEYEIAGEIEGIIYKNGGFLAFPIICTVHGETLHNHFYGNKLKAGNLLLTDTGAESPLHYCADITRTYPVGGKFTPKQKEIYDIALKANTESINSSKPDVLYKDIHINAWKIIADGLKAIGIMKADSAQAAQKGAVALFMPHGLGHMLGLDAHDMEALGENNIGYDKQTKRSELFGLSYLRLAKKLEKDFVLTVEPGIYFIPELIKRWRNQKKFEEFINYEKLENYMDFGGIRIEDNILITENGCRLLGKPIHKTTKEIEQAMS